MKFEPVLRVEIVTSFFWIPCVFFKIYKWKAGLEFGFEITRSRGFFSINLFWFYLRFEY